tara:strand:- start:205 stop:339 length:135 start_codon:yes stop_codon:yes gene_type:complete
MIFSFIFHQIKEKDYNIKYKHQDSEFDLRLMPFKYDGAITKRYG